jgi:hypothetical protein
MKETSKMNATQRIEALENLFSSLGGRLDEQFKIVADEINRLNELNVALAKRLNAIIKAGDEGDINNKSVKGIIISEAAKELKSKVDMLVEQGILTLNNDREIDDNTFVVAREIDSEGEEINPRTQFLVGSLQEEAKKLVLGRKAGDSVNDAGLKQTLIIMETYDVKQIDTSTSFEENQESTEAPAGAEVMKTTKTKKSKKA